MGYTTTAYAQEKKWVGVDCEMCGTHYSCLVEGYGQASDALVPFSDDTLKEFALLNLETSLQQKATSMPCPQCGNYHSSHVERSLHTAGRLLVWGLFIGLFVLTAWLVAVVAPKTPGWIGIVILIVTFIVARVLGGVLANKFNPNNNLERNLLVAQTKVKTGVLRLKTDSVGASITNSPPAN